MNLNMNTIIAAAIVFAAYKWAPNAFVKGAAAGVAGTIIAKQIPYVSDAIA